MSAIIASTVPGPAVPARAEASPQKGITTVELTWVEQATERWIRFGAPLLDQILDRRRRLLSFAANSVFAFVRWATNDYGTILSRLDIVRAVAPGDAYCSEHCRKQVESPTSDQTGDCRCGHAECDTGRAQAERMP